MTRSVQVATAVAALIASLGVSACKAAPSVLAPGVESPPPQDVAAHKKEMAALGPKYQTAQALYQALKDQAKGGRRLSWSTLPDWSGVYTRTPAPGFAFDPDQPADGMPTAKLTPEYQARMVKRIEDAKHGIEWDPISTCAPPGHPRWLTEPFLREFVVTPDQTWLINEMVNDIRRVYTDGRDHVPAADRYPLKNGDSIGFWDGQKLVIHTNQLREGIYQRSQPDYTDQVETVEIWQKADDKTLAVDVWVYDPPALVEPWYVRQTYQKLSDPDRSLRIRYWDCAENQNNSVYQTSDGSTQFKNFTFTKDGQKGKP